MATLDNRHSLALPYWARPGLVSFAKKASGGGKDDGELDDDEDDDEDDDDEDDEDADKTDEELRAELKKTRAALGKANGQSARNRRRRRDLEAQLATRDGGGKKKSKSSDDDDELDVDAIREEARKEGAKASLNIVKKSKIESALSRAGISDKKTVARLARMVDLDDIDIDDDGTVDGVDEAIETLKEDMPALFTKTRRRRESVAGENDRDGNESRQKNPKTASQIAADRLLGRGK